MEQKSLLYIFSSAAPQRTAYSEVLSQMAAHLRTGSPLQAGEIAGFEPRTAVLQSGVATNEPPLLPFLHKIPFPGRRAPIGRRTGWAAFSRPKVTSYLKTKAICNLWQ